MDKVPNKTVRQIDRILAHITMPSTGPVKKLLASGPVGSYGEKAVLFTDTNIFVMIGSQYTNLRPGNSKIPWENKVSGIIKTILLERRGQSLKTPELGDALKKSFAKYGAVDVFPHEVCPICKGDKMVNEGPGEGFSRCKKCNRAGLKKVPRSRGIKGRSGDGVFIKIVDDYYNPYYLNIIWQLLKELGAEHFEVIECGDLTFPSVGEYEGTDPKERRFYSFAFIYKNFMAVLACMNPANPNDSRFTELSPDLSSFFS